MLADLIRDALIHLSARLVRTSMLVGAIALSIGGLIAGVGVGRTTAAQLNDDLAAEIVDVVTVTAAPGAVAEDPSTPIFAADAIERLEGAPMIRCGGMRLDLESADARVRRTADAPATRVPIYGASSSYLCALGVAGDYGQLSLTASAQIAYVGGHAAEELAIPTGDPSALAGVFVWVHDQRYAVAGIIASDEPAVAQSVVIPYTAAVTVMGSDAQARLVVSSQPGAGANVSDVIRSILRPEAPLQYQVTRVSDLSDIRRGVDNQLGRLILVMGTMLVSITCLLVGSSTATSVVSRTSEIGLRRAFGFSRSQILATFLIEGAVLGTVGGLAGGCLGLVIVVAASMTQGWEPSLTLDIYILGPVIGLATSVLASLIPAAQAARIRPADALRVE